MISCNIYPLNNSIAQYNICCTCDCGLCCYQALHDHTDAAANDDDYRPDTHKEGTAYYM